MMLGWCAGVSAKQFDVLLKVMKQQQHEQKPKLQPMQSQSELLANVSPQEVFASSGFALSLQACKSAVGLFGA